MLSTTTGSQLRERIRDYIVFDFETTGVSVKKDDIIEIAALKVIDQKIVGEFSTLVNPQRPIPYYASKVNGIWNNMVENAPIIDDILPAFLDFIEELPLVGHNINTFDLKVLYRECHRIYKKMPDNQFVDTLILSRKLLPNLEHHKLTDLAEYYNIETKGAHRALADCYMNQAVYEMMWE